VPGRRRTGPVEGRRPGRGLVAAAVGIALGAASLAGCSVSAMAEVPSGSALAALDRLEVRGRAPMTGYDREAFGFRAVDVDRNGCDARNDVLRRDLEDVKRRSDGCVVTSGVLHDPYSGETITFRRGKNASAVQIDHVVAVADAWQKGAQRWDRTTRETFANDPMNLLAVEGSLNSAKGSSDAATWLPPNRGFRCAYVARQVAVKRAYGLWVTKAEHRAMAAVLRTCPDEPLPPRSAVTPGSSAPDADADVHYASCAEVRAAGAAPLRRGDAGYRSGLDGDGDGVACE